MAQSTETKLNKRFDQNIEITGTLTVGNDSVNIPNWDTAYSWGDWSIGVNKTFVDALNIDADTLDGQNSTYYDQSQFTGVAFYSSNSSDKHDTLEDSNYNNIGYVYGTSNPSSYNDGSIYTAAYSTSWVSQIFADYRSGDFWTRTKNNGSWQSWNKILTSANYEGALDAHYLRSDQSDTISGDLTVDRLRISASNDASTTSTLHGLQVGSTGSLNMIMDNNELMARNNGAVSGLNFNPDGGDVTIHNNTTAGTFTIGGNDVYHAGNLTASVINALNVDADTLDGINSNQFLRSDQAGTITGTTAQSVILTVKSTNAGTSGYSELHISNNNNDKLVLGSIGSNYSANSDWSDSSYIYDAGQSALRIKASNQLEFFSGGYTIASNRRMVIDSTGKVGIGTGSPQRPLHIQSNDAGYGQVRIYRDSTTQGEVSMGFFGKSNGATNEAWVIGEGGWGNSNDFVIGNENGGAGGSVRLLIQRNGDIGIGNTAPQAYSGYRVLHVGDASTTGLLKLGTGTSADGLEIWTDTSGITHFNNNGSTGVMFFKNDDIGIGTTNPMGKLDVFTDGIYYTHSNASSRNWLTAANYLAWGDFAIVQSDAQGGNPYTPATSTPRFYINSSGNVGIDTTSPNAKLSLGTSVVDNKLYLYDGSSDKYGFGIRSSQFMIYSGAQGSSTGGITFGKYDGTTFTENVRFTNSGNVGIGVTDPDQKLEVNGNAHINYSLLGRGIRAGNRGEFFLNATGTTDVSEIFFGYGNGFTENNIRWGISDRGTTDDTLRFYKGPANSGFSEVMVLKASNSSVGIGNIVPNQKLDVDGNIKFGTWATSGSRYIGFGRNDTGAFGTAGASGIEIESVTSSGNGTFDQNVHLWTHWYNGGSNRTLTATWDKKVGINTTSPNGTFQVNGSNFDFTVNYDSNNQISMTSTGTTGGYNAFTIGQSNTTNNVGVMRFVYAGSGSTGNKLNFGFYSNDDILQIEATRSVIVDGSLRAAPNGFDYTPNETTFTHTLAADSGTGTKRVVNFDGNGGNPSVWWTSQNNAIAAIDAMNTTNGLAFWVNSSSGSWQRNFYIDTGKTVFERSVGINNASPSYTLDVDGTFRVTNSSDLRKGINLRRDMYNKSGISWYNTTYYNWQDYMSPAGQTGCGANGNLTAPSGLGTVTSWALRSRMEGVSTYGWLWETGGSGGGGATASAKMELGANTGTLRVVGDVIAYASDKRLKTNIKPIDNAVEKIKKISGVTYDWVENIEDEYDFHPNNKHEAGVLAQEIKEVLPEAVMTAPMNAPYTEKTGVDHEFLTVKYERIVPLLIEAVKELTNKVEELENKLNGTERGN